MASWVALDRPAGLGDALGIVPPGLHGHRNGSQSMSIFFCRRFYVLHNHSQTTMLWSIKNKAELYYCSLLCITLVCILWRPAYCNELCFGYHCRRRASDCCNLQSGSRNKLISHLLYIFILNPSVAASSKPFQRGSRGWGMLVHQNHAAGGENGSIMVGMFVFLCLASQKPSEREFFRSRQNGLRC